MRSRRPTRATTASLAAGLDLSVARAGQGSVVIEETAGFSAIYEGGCFGLPGTCTPVPALDSYTVYLASKPVCAPGVADGDCWVYVTVSVAYPPQSEHGMLTLGSIPDGPPTGNEGDTFLVTSGALPGSLADFLRQIYLNGVSEDVQKRSIVLAFNGLNYGTKQTVYMYAVDDARAEGTRVVTASHSVIQTTCDPNKPKNCFDGAIVRNVEVTVYDNDQPGVLITQIDPNTSNPDNNSAVLEGWGTLVAGPTGHPITEQLDRYQIVARKRSGRRRDGRHRHRPQRRRARSAARLPDEQRRPLLRVGRLRGHRPDQVPADAGHLPRHVHRRRTRQLVRADHDQPPRAQRLRARGSAQHDDHAHGQHVVDDRRGVPRLLRGRHEDDDPRARSTCSCSTTRTPACGCSRATARRWSPPAPAIRARCPRSRATRTSSA